MRVQDVMTTDPRTCLPGDTAFKAASIMKELETGIVPIIENKQSRRLVGVVDAFRKLSITEQSCGMSY